MKRNTGFTLVELLVVIAIIGILAAVVTVSLATSQARARDAKRISMLKQLNTAISLYHAKNGTYYGAPPGYYIGRSGSETANNCGSTAAGTVPEGVWCRFETYMTEFFNQPFPRDILTDTYRVHYKHSWNLLPSGYGLGIELEVPSDVSRNDGGYRDDMFELGAYPAYCKNKYAGVNGDWTIWDFTRVCVGGN